ncbi:odorant receptor coreceptor [Neocloeon triangulifer]|uniref:odorant receptor coreceptor n=1 Tax=Neocloeon triangulifer TaxID=2078957 RepID=UPI00286F8EE7|nr:odorant receptor coreceptor [Neocloeon triangulifer]
MMKAEKTTQRSLSEDLRPLMRLLRLSGHFLPDYEKGGIFGKSVYSLVHLSLGITHFIFLLVKLLMQFGDTVSLISNTLTMLFFLHGITKALYFAVKRKQFYATVRTWEKSHSHPLFAASDAKHRAAFAAETRRLLQPILVATALTVFFWAIHPFVGDAETATPTATESVLNDTFANSTQDSPTEKAQKGTKLLINAWYPWDPYQSTFAYFVTYCYQLYWLLFCICQINLLDALFCSWLIYGCEHLRHLKDAMQYMMQLSVTDGLSAIASDNGYLMENLDTKIHFPNEVPPATAPKMAFQRLRRVVPAETPPVRFGQTMDSLMMKFPSGDNSETGRRGVVIRSAIKYWVERHKHILKYIESVGDSYGMALLLHMLTSTVTLTLLSYEATKITGINLHAFTVIGYLCYTLAQVFLFCLFGNRLIEESVSVMHAAYSCPWYNGSEEAKTFVQIVCQQCQRPLSVSGAKFFTVSLDLFASVLGAVVTYFMVLIQLN